MPICDIPVPRFGFFRPCHVETLLLLTLRMKRKRGKKAVAESWLSHADLQRAGVTLPCFSFLLCRDSSPFNTAHEERKKKQLPRSVSLSNADLLFSRWRRSSILIMCWPRSGCSADGNSGNTVVFEECQHWTLPRATSFARRILKPKYKCFANCTQNLLTRCKANVYRHVLTTLINDGCPVICE